MIVTEPSSFHKSISTSIDGICNQDIIIVDKIHQVGIFDGKRYFGSKSQQKKRTMVGHIVMLNLHSTNTPAQKLQ